MATYTTNLHLTKPELTDAIAPDMFADDFDAIDAAVSHVKVTVPSTGWSATEPYEQTINVSGMTATWIPGIPVLVPTGTAEADQACQAALSCVSLIASATGTLTFTCYDSAPEDSFTIRIPRMIGE